MKIFLYSTFILIVGFTNKTSFNNTTNQNKIIESYDFKNVVINEPLRCEFILFNNSETGFKVETSKLMFSYVNDIQIKVNSSSTYNKVNTSLSNVVLNTNDTLKLIVVYTPTDLGVFNYKVPIVKNGIDTSFFEFKGNVLKSGKSHSSVEYFRKKIHENSCNDITESFDEIDNEKTYRATNSDKFTLIKVINKSVATYYLNIKTEAYRPNVNEKGFTILYTDGTKLLKPSEKIDVEVGGNKNYIYSVFVRLTATDIIALSSKRIKICRLYVYDETFEWDEAETLIGFFKCLKIKK